VGTSKQDCTSLPKLESFVRIMNLSTKQAVLERERERDREREKSVTEDQTTDRCCKHSPSPYIIL